MIGADDKFNVFNAGGYCDVVVDVVGTFYLYPASAAVTGSQVASVPMPAAQLSTQFKRP
ncbi:hypothetical protein AB0H83_27855 [Dactylosporangium sp. NPDC050688]|uniref:hypothetical protein n=1 Tax=Dactylosporangium sp. NPDC050688 TaxID=3157217 RepID=UPI0033EC1B4F